MYCQEHQREGGTELGYESLMSCMRKLKEGEKKKKSQKKLHKLIKQEENCWNYPTPACFNQD